MLEYYKHNKRKITNAREIVPVLFYNAGLFLWHVVGRDLYFLKCDLNEKFKIKYREKMAIVTPTLEVNDELIDKDIESFMSKIDKEIIEKDVDLEDIPLTLEKESPKQDKKENDNDFLLLMKTFYLEEIITTPYVETLKCDMFEFKAEDGKPIVLTSSEKTLLLGVEKPGEFISLSGYKYQREGYYSGEVLIIIDKELYSFFSYITELGERIKTITRFANCTDDQQRLILNMAAKNKKAVSNTAATEKALDGCRNIIKDKETIEMMFHICKDALPTDIRYHCEQLVTEMHSISQRKQEEALMILTDVLYAYSEDDKDIDNNYPSFEECVKILKQYRYGDEELIRDIALRMRLLFRSKSKGTVFCFLGKPGVGKTQLAKGMAKCFGKAYAEISCRDMTATDMGGASRIFDCARHGKFQETLTKYGTNACILLDEFDKMVINEKDGNPYNLFDSAFDDRKTYEDIFTNVPIPVDNVCFILTFNDVNNIPEHIKNRFSGNIFNIDSYSDTKKAEIGKRFVIPAHKKRYKFTDDEVQFTDDGLLALARKTHDDGVREFSQKSERLLSVVNNQLENGAKMPIIVDATFVNNYFVEITANKGIGFHP